MKLNLRKNLTALMLLLFSIHTAVGVNYDLLKSTPIGSWQLRTEISTDERGRQTLSEIKTSLIGKEVRDGVDHFWVETAVQNYRMRNGNKDRPDGDRIVIKILIEASLFAGNPEDVFNNMRGLGKEIIMQNGNQDPILIEEGGALGGAMMQALGMEVNYDFREVGRENVRAASGNYRTRVIEGSGSVETRVLFRTIRVESESKQWLSDDVPFSIVKATSSTTMDGKTSKTESTLIEYGMSGAESEIRGTPQSLSLPGLGSLFG